MAFFELCIKEGKSPFDADKIMAALANLQSKLNVAAGQIRSAPRAQNISVTKGLIQHFFEEKEPPITQQGAGLAIRFENALRRSKVETAAYECKQGFLALDDARTLNQDMLDKLIQTVCAIANIGPQSSGGVFIGVADKAADTDRIVALDSVKPLRVGARHVVGIERELPHMRVTLEEYKRKVVDRFANSRLSEPLRSTILATVDCIDYRGHSVVCIWIPPQRQVSTVADAVFVRQGSSTEKVDGFNAMQAVASRFPRA